MTNEVQRALEAADQCIADMVDVYGRHCSMLVLDEAVKSLRDDAGKKVKLALRSLEAKAA